MRTFIAVELPLSTKDYLAEIQKKLEKSDLSAKWVHGKNLHITLKFLGETSEAQITEVKNLLKEVEDTFKAIEVQLAGFGFFPNERRPRVFFVRTTEEEKLKKIATLIEEKLEKFGFVKEGRFRSHITLARIKAPKNITAFIEESKKNPLQGNFSVKYITLYKSTLTKTGPIYEKLYQAVLSG